MNVEDLGVFELKVNGSSISAGLNVFREGIMQSGYGLPVATAKFVFADHHGALVGDQALNDGTKLEILLGQTPEDSVTYVFSVYSINSYEDNGANIQEAYCMLDVPALTIGAFRDMYEDTSSGVVGAIAGEVGLEFDGPDSTDDSMTWINCGSTRLQFLEQTCLRAYASDKSCISLAVDFDTIRMKDLFAQFSKEPEYSLYYSINIDDDDPGIKVSMDESKPCSRNGFYNQATNYGHTHWQHSLSGEPIKLDKIDPVVLGDGLPINSDIKGQVEASAFTMGPGFDTGSGDLPGANVHENYYKARYQNLRFLSLFTEGVTTLSRTFLNIPLFTPVRYVHGSVRDDDSAESKKHTGNYIVGGKTLLLRGKHYAELYDLYRPFINETGNTPTVGGPSSSSASDGSPTPQISREQDLDAAPTSSDSVNSISAKATNATGNKPSIKQPSIIDKANDVNGQINSNVSGIASNGDTLFDDTVKTLNDNLDKAEKKLKDLGDSLGADFLADKYGAGYDKADALMNEFQGAMAQMDLCKKLSGLETLTVDFTMNNKDKVLNVISERESVLQGALDSNIGAVNALIDKGGVPDSYVDAPDIKAKCNAETVSEINKALKDTLPDKCLDKRDIDKLNGPSIDLSQKLRKLQKQLEDLLCAMGLGV